MWRGTITVTTIHVLSPCQQQCSGAFIYCETLPLFVQNCVPSLKALFNDNHNRKFIEHFQWLKALYDLIKQKFEIHKYIHRENQWDKCIPIHPKQNETHCACAYAHTTHKHAHFVCTCTQTHTCTHTHTNTHAQTHTHTCTHACMHARTHTHRE